MRGCSIIVAANRQYQDDSIAILRFNFVGLG